MTQGKTCDSQGKTATLSDKVRKLIHYRHSQGTMKPYNCYHITNKWDVPSIHPKRGERIILCQKKRKEPILIKLVGHVNNDLNLKLRL